MEAAQVPLSALGNPIPNISGFWAEAHGNDPAPGGTQVDDALPNENPGILQQRVLDEGQGAQERQVGSVHKPLDRYVSKYNERQQSTTAARLGSVSKRMEMQHRLDNLEIHFERLRDSTEALVKRINTSKADGTPRILRPRMKKLEEEVRLDLKALEDQCQDLRAISASLKDCDDELEDSELAFDNVCRAIFTELRLRQLVSDDVAGDDTSLKPTLFFKSTGSPAPASQLPRELENYFTAYSRLRNMSERIDELVGEQQDQSNRRELLRDQGRDLGPSDEEFFSEWQKLLDPAKRDYEKALVDVESTRKLCADASIEIPAWARIDSIPAGDKRTEPEKLPARGIVSQPNSNPMFVSHSLDAANATSEIHWDQGSQGWESPPRVASEGLAKHGSGVNVLVSGKPDATWRSGSDGHIIGNDQKTSTHASKVGQIDKPQTQKSLLPAQDFTSTLRLSEVPAQVKGGPNSGAQSLEQSYIDDHRDGSVQKSHGRVDYNAHEAENQNHMDSLGRTGRPPHAGAHHTQGELTESTERPRHARNDATFVPQAERVVSHPRAIHPPDLRPTISVKGEQHNSQHLSISSGNNRNGGLQPTMQRNSLLSNQRAPTSSLLTTRSADQYTSSAATRVPASNNPTIRSVATKKRQGSLDEVYRLQKRPAKYFQIGRVFLMLHTEPYGEARMSGQKSASVNTANVDVFTVAYGELVFSKVRRFIVIREGVTSCQALAISTHNGKGVLQMDASEHGIVYTGSHPPNAFKYESGILPYAIRIDPDDPSQQLHPTSRLNYGKTYTIEHDVRVKPYGIVNNKSIYALINQFATVFFRTKVTPVMMAMRQPSRQHLQSLGFTPNQVTATTNMIIKRGASPSTAISSIARFSAMQAFIGRDAQQELANHVVNLLMAGLSFPQAVTYVSLVEANLSHRVEGGGSADSDHEDPGNDDYEARES